jgi:arylsulfatase A-like enzyme
MSINRREFLAMAGKATAGLALGGCLAAIGRQDGAAGGAGRKLNIVYILIDDMGWTDLACYGSKYYETPNIDRLAGEGMRFTQAYAACTVCSPTRASIMTGKYPARLHLTDWIPGHKRGDAKLKVPDWTQYLPLDEVTLAKALKAAGYATAHVGKWHLGGPQYYPEHQGFDLNIGGTSAGQPGAYFYPYKNSPKLPDGKEGEYLTDRLTDEALKFIETNKDNPFFLYLPHYAVHQPIAGKKEMVEKYRNKPPQGGHSNAVYAAMIQSVDESVGRIVKKLEDLRITDRTVIFFMSDNGGLARVTSNAPLRAGKGSAYEGGVREPFIVKWPGVVKPGGVCDVPVISVDHYPTILEIAGVAGDAAHNKNVDGESLVPLLKQSGNLRREAVYWHYPHYHPGGATPYGAVREGDFKLVEFFEDMHVELYNLKEDVGETKDLAAAMPDKADALRKKLHAWRQTVAAQMPTPNPSATSKATVAGNPRALNLDWTGFPEDP